MEDVQQASLEKLVANICLAEGVENAKVSYSSNTKKKGFVANMVKIQVIGTNKELHLVAKCAPTDETFRENIEAREMFVQEIKFYTELMPLYSSLQERFGAKKSRVSVAKCLGCVDTPKSELIVLEDLMRRGYVLQNSLVPLDKMHLELVLKEYGKYHAIPLAYKHHDFVGYKNLIGNMTTMHKLFLNSKTMEILINACNNLKDMLDPKEHGGMYEAFSKMCNDVRGIYKTFTISDEYSVIYHGDSWCNNMLFKYEDATNHPVEVKLLDFQIIGPGSAALDISYFLMANSSPEDIKNIDHYFKVYYDSLSENLRDLNCDPDSVYPYSIFQEQWKKFGVYGLIFAVTALKFATAAPEETPDLVKDFEKSVNFVGENAEEYKRRTEAIVRYYYEAGIIYILI